MDWINLATFRDYCMVLVNMVNDPLFP